MAFSQPGQFGPEALLDSAGNALVGAAVSVPNGYSRTLDAFGNLTVTGPASDAVTVTITPAGGSPVTATIRVDPKVAELDSVRAAAAAALPASTAAATYATQAALTAAVADASGAVSSVAGRTGAVVLAAADVSGVDTPALRDAAITTAVASLETAAHASSTYATQSALSAKADSSTVTTTLAGKADATATTSALALKADLVAGKVPASQLPSATYALTFSGTKTAPYAAVPGEIAVMNVPAGASTLTLPSAPDDRSVVGVRAVGATGAAPLTVQRSGSDTVGDAGSLSATLPLSGETTIYVYQASQGRWLPVSNVKPLSALDARYDAAGAASSAQAAAIAGAPVQSVAGKTGTVSLVKGDVGLGSVDNTADASKPVSTAQAAANSAVQAFAIQRANHTGQQAASTVTGLATVATSGVYTDLTSRPTLGTLAAKSAIAVPTDVTATGTASATTFLRGDGTWATPAGGGGSAAAFTIGSGQYLSPPMISTPGNGSQGTNFMRAHFLDIPVAVVITGIGTTVTAAAASALCRLGIYSDVAGVPTSLLVDAGTIDASTTGVKEAAVASLNLAAGRYWLVGCTQGAAASYPTLANHLTPLNSIGTVTGNAGGTAAPLAGYYGTAGGVSGALPASFGAVTAQIQGGLIRCYLKVA